MSDSGEKTEKPTAKRTSEAWAKGQFAKTAEIQTVFVLTAGLWVLSTSGDAMIRVLSTSMVQTLGQVGQLSLSTTSIYGYVNAIMGRQEEPFNFRRGLRIQHLVETIQASSRERSWRKVGSGPT